MPSNAENVSSWWRHHSYAGVESYQCKNLNLMWISIENSSIKWASFFGPLFSGHGTPREKYPCLIFVHVTSATHTEGKPSISRSRLFHSLNKLHAYWSMQPRAFRRLPSLLSLCLFAPAYLIEFDNFLHIWPLHYSYVIMDPMASQTTGVSIVGA